MNFYQRFHGRTPPETHSHPAEHQGQRPPFWVRYYDWIVNIVTLGKTQRIHRETISLAALQPGDTVLDMGCGTGKLILAAEKVVGPEGTAVGLDVEPAMIAQARLHAHKKQSRALFEVASIEEIPYPDEYFDMAFSTLVFHHLTDAQKEAGFAELRRVLKPNGRLLIVDLNPSRRSLATSLPGHNQLAREDYVRSEAVKRLAAAGFGNIQSGPHPFPQLSYALGEKG